MTSPEQKNCCKGLALPNLYEQGRYLQANLLYRFCMLRLQILRWAHGCTPLQHPICSRLSKNWYYCRHFSLDDSTNLQMRVALASPALCCRNSTNQIRAIAPLRSPLS